MLKFGKCSWHLVKWRFGYGILFLHFLMRKFINQHLQIHSQPGPGILKPVKYPPCNSSATKCCSNLSCDGCCRLVTWLNVGGILATNIGPTWEFLTNFYVSHTLWVYCWFYKQVCLLPLDLYITFSLVTSLHAIRITTPCNMSKSRWSTYPKYPGETTPQIPPSTFKVLCKCMLRKEFLITV